MASSEKSFEHKKSTKSINYNESAYEIDRKESDTWFGISRKGSFSEQISPSAHLKDMNQSHISHTRCRSFANDMLNKPVTLNVSTGNPDSRPTSLFVQSERDLADSNLKKSCYLFDKYLEPEKQYSAKKSHTVTDGALKDWTSEFIRNYSVEDTTDDHYQLKKIRGPLEAKLDSSMEKTDLRGRKSDFKDKTPSKALQASLFLEKTKNSPHLNVAERESKLRPKPSIAFGGSMYQGITQNEQKPPSADNLVRSQNMNRYVTTRHSRPLLFKLPTGDLQRSYSKIEPIPETAENPTSSRRRLQVAINEASDTQNDYLEKFNENSSVVESRSVKKVNDKERVSSKELFAKIRASQNGTMHQPSFKLNEIRNQRKVDINYLRL